MGYKKGGEATMALDGELSSSGAIFSFGDNGRQTSDKGLAWV